MNICDQAHKDIDRQRAKKKEHLKGYLIALLGEEYEQFLTETDLGFSLPTCYEYRTIEFHTHNLISYSYSFECENCNTYYHRSHLSSKMEIVKLITYNWCDGCNKKSIKDQNPWRRLVKYIKRIISPE